jgi:hypothetical protein
MSTLAETINNALAAVGPATEDRLDDIVAELGDLSLGEEGRLAVLASAIGTAAATYHARHKSVYLEAVRTWSLEISVARDGLALRPVGVTVEGAIEDGTEILTAGLAALVDTMVHAGVRIQDRLVTELALFARLLGQYDANTIHLALMAVTEALAEKDYRLGQRIEVPLEEAALPLGRDACLARLAPRGLA